MGEALIIGGHNYLVMLTWQNACCAMILDDPLLYVVKNMKQFQALLNAWGF